MTFDEIYQKELKKLEAQVSKLPENYRELIMPTLENLAWMKSKLDETRTLLQPSAVLLKTQDGARKNPGYEAYAQLLDRYIKAMKVLLDILDSIKPQPDRKGTALDDIKKRSQARKPKADKKRRS